ncbi:MAG: hypothetical protein ABI700_15535 [Chloroflexota bacterium]
MTKTVNPNEPLDRLNQTVIDAAAFFASADEGLSDGRHNVHGVLAQLVFWHEQYVETARALLEQRPPPLKAGSFERLNQVARSHFASDSLTMMAYDLSCLQKELDGIVRELSDWSVNFPIKNDSEPRSVNERLVEIELHIRLHCQRLKRSAQVKS